MENDMIPTAAREIQVADAEKISSMTCDVLDLKRELNDNNEELCLLNDALENLGKTLDRNKRLKNIVRRSMQDVITKL